MYFVDLRSGNLSDEYFVKLSSLERFRLLRMMSGQGQVEEGRVKELMEKKTNVVKKCGVCSEIIKKHNCIHYGGKEQLKLRGGIAACSVSSEKSSLLYCIIKYSVSHDYERIIMS